MAIDSNEPLLKQTLKTVGLMVGGCVLFVGTMSIIAVGVVGHVVGSSSTESSSATDSTLVPADHVHGDMAVPHEIRVDSMHNKMKTALPPRTPHQI
jgi:hypothetical protein